MTVLPDRQVLCLVIELIAPCADDNTNERGSRGCSFGACAGRSLTESLALRRQSPDLHFGRVPSAEDRGDDPICVPGRIHENRRYAERAGRLNDETCIFMN